MTNVTAMQGLRRPKVSGQKNGEHDARRGDSEETSHLVNAQLCEQPGEPVPLWQTRP